MSRVAAAAPFWAPKRVIVIDTIGMAANCKLDYKRLKATADNSAGDRS